MTKKITEYTNAWKKFLLSEADEANWRTHGGRYKGERDIMGRANPTRARWDREKGVTRGQFSDYQLAQAEKLGMHPSNIPDQGEAFGGRHDAESPPAGATRDGYMNRQLLHAQQADWDVPANVAESIKKLQKVLQYLETR